MPGWTSEPLLRGDEQLRVSDLAGAVGSGARGLAESFPKHKNLPGRLAGPGCSLSSLNDALGAPGWFCTWLRGAQEVLTHS